MKSDYDGAWKDLLGNHFRECLESFFPAVAAAIDWRVDPVFLEQELRELAITPDASGNRVDVLVSVQLLKGGSQLIYLHLEVQTFFEEDFAARVHGCFQGICRATGRDVVTLVILADLNPHWKPERYDYSLLGCKVAFTFPVCKILQRLPALRGDNRLPAHAAVAQIEALKTSGNPDKRLAARWRLTRRLLESGLTREQIINSFRLLSWMMKLPEEQTLKFRAQVVEFESMNSPSVYMTDIEELLLKEGMEQGIEKGIEKGEWIGKIVLLESLMGIKSSSRKDLEPESVPALKRRFKALEKASVIPLRRKGG